MENKPAYFRKKALPIRAVSTWYLEPTVQVGVYKSHQDYRFRQAEK